MVWARCVVGRTSDVYARHMNQPFPDPPTFCLPVQYEGVVEETIVRVSVVVLRVASRQAKLRVL